MFFEAPKSVPSLDRPVKKNPLMFMPFHWNVKRQKSNNSAAHIDDIDHIACLSAAALAASSGLSIA